jgi:hypothetical protein
VRAYEGDDGEVEVPLVGGDVTEGLVRVGATIRRPALESSAAVQLLLAELEAAGFHRAPRHLGVDSHGRHVLSFIEGEVAGRPWPAWVADPERAASVAHLVRQYDDVAMGIGLPEWSMDLRHIEPPGTPASIAGPSQFLAHLDITPENVVFRGGLAHALIDFDFARPATRVEEVGNLLLWWAAWMPEQDREPATRGLDAAARGALLVDAYGLEPEDRELIVATVQNQAERSWFSMKHRAETLGGGWRRMWEDGVGDRILRRQQWLADHAAVLHAAVT